MAGKGGAQGGQPGSPDNGLKPIWMILAVFLIGWILWSTSHTYITRVIFAVKLAEIKTIYVFYKSAVLEYWKVFIQTNLAEDVQWNSIVLLCQSVGEYIRYPFALIILGLAAFVYKKNPLVKFKKSYSMKGLREQEFINWPQILPVIKRDLAKEDISSGPWAMALTPMEFSRKHNLLKRDEFVAKVGNMEIPLTAGIKKGESRRIFTLQLGPYWNGFDALPMHTKALAGVFMAKINRDRDSAVKLLKSLDYSAEKGKIDVQMVNALVNKHKNTELVEEIVQKHAYVLTVMAALITASRDDGVMASADFLWLKPVDRRLWYILNTMGRQTPFVEVAGIYAHWLVEKKLKQRCLMPMVEEAVKALELAIKDVKISQKEWEALPL